MKTITLWIISILAGLFVIYIIWGIEGLAVTSFGIAIISGLVAWGTFSDRDTGCGTVLLFGAIAAIFGSISYSLGEWSQKIKEETKSQELYSQIVLHPTPKNCKQYIQEYYYSNNADKVREIWLNQVLQEAEDFDYKMLDETNDSIISINPIQELQDFISQNEGSIYERRAQSAIVSICDSLYAVANHETSIAVWRQYQKLVPTDYFKDSEARIEELENQAWDTESKAWRMALAENSISGFEKYKRLYPYGSHIRFCEKMLVDLEVARVFSGSYRSLPEMERIGYGGSVSNITVYNDTPYTLTLLYSGSDSKRLVLSSQNTATIKLKNGLYHIVASVTASNVQNYAGTANLEGGYYSVSYYIKSYHY